MKEIILLFFVVLIISCSSDSAPGESLLDIPYNPRVYELVILDHFPPMVIPEDNPLTEQGVELGRHLFYDPILSSDNTLSCSSFDLSGGSFTGNEAFSEGVTGERGKRSYMSLLNVGFNNNGYFGDGRSAA